MKTSAFRLPGSFKLLLVVAVSVLLATPQAMAQCVELTSGLQSPIGTALTELGNLIVSESGTPAPNTGRLSIVGDGGTRRTLVSGLPSGISDVGSVAGPAGILMRGRTLYVAISVGDVDRFGPLPGTTIPNPNPVSSPIFSSVLAIHFSANVEKTTQGFSLTAAAQQALASGQTITLSNGGGDKISIWVVADFPNYISFPLPIFAGNIQHSNPFRLIAIGDALYVTDGGRNLVWEVDLATGSFRELVHFPLIPNPLFGIVPAGGPTLDAVPTGISAVGNQLLVTLFRGVPFPPGTSTVEQVNPATGSDTVLIGGLKTAIDVIAIEEHGDTNYLVLQHASAGPFFGSPGLVLRFDNPAGPPFVVANCLTLPSSMTLSRKTDTLYVSELGGRIVTVPVP
jgi:hypothetical protein